MEIGRGEIKVIMPRLAQTGASPITKVLHIRIRHINMKPW